jgi:ABC-2 type transport system permease protein
MTAASLPASAVTGRVPVHNVTFGGVLRSEWIKLRSVRSTVIVGALTVLALVAYPLPLSYQRGANPIAESLTGVYLAPLTISILGVLVITGEYTTGMILATLGAVPRRLGVLWAKAVVLTLAVFPVALAATFAAFLIGQARYGSHGVSLSAPGALRAVTGAALFLTVLGLLGLGLGALIRNTAGGVTAAVGVAFVLPYAYDLLPPGWQPHVAPYLPMQAGQAVWAVPPQQTQNTLHPWAGFALFCGYAAVTLAAAAIALNRRDATPTVGWRDWARILVGRRGRAASAAGAAGGVAVSRTAGAGVGVSAGPAPAAARLPRLASVGPVTLGNVIRSEWIKLRSLRSTVILLAVSAALILAEGPIIAAALDWHTMSAADRAAFDPIDLSLLGVGIAGFLVSILGVLLITGEYGTGMARATFSAVPRRLPVLWAKAAVLAPTAFAVSLVASFAAFGVSQALFGSHGVSLGAPGALRAVFGAALSVTALGLLGLGLGFLIRNTAAGIGAVTGLTFVLEIVRIALPRSWQTSVVPYLPGHADRAVYAVAPDNGQMLTPWHGFALFCGYVAVTMAVAAVLLRRRDA